MDPATIIKQALGDKYEILSVIGKGGMATVYKAIHKSLNRPIALKVIHQNLVHDEEFVKRFIREAQVCASLSHPNIITVYDAASLGTVHFMSMEFLEGMTLLDLINSNGALSADETSSFIIPIAEALDYMHRKGIIHRDVKSSNIFITKNDRVVLMDFGIVFSEDRDPLSHSGTILGTPEYMSPEQAEGKLKIDGRSDIYSLGVILFECLTGTLPFHSDNYITTLHHVLHEAPPTVTSVNQQVPKWISSIVSACLIKDRNLRISDGFTLSTSLRNKEKVKIPGTIHEQLTRKIAIGDIKIQPDNFNKKKEPSHSKRQKSLLAAIIITVTLIILILGWLFVTPSKTGTLKVIIEPPQKIVDPDAERKANIAKFITSGDQQFGKQDFETALNNYEKALHLDPSNSNIQQKISESKSKWVQSIISQGDNYLQNKNYDLALSTYAKAKRLDSANNFISTKILEANNRLLKFLISQGDNYLRNQDFDLALSAYAEAKQIDPLNDTVANKIRNAKTEKKNYEIQQYKLIQKRKNEETLRNLGIEMILVENSSKGNFYLGKSEVTQRLWKAIMGSNSSSNQGDDLPVETISWNDVQQFLQKLNQRTNMNFRLPTSSEWEFAAQGGQPSLTYSGSIKISDVGWYEANSGSKTHPVMQLSPNYYGLYDMTGNVWEFCSDHSLKGGSWLSPSSKCSIMISGNPKDKGDYTIGFRICRSVV